jgi:hypothetical protein
MSTHEILAYLWEVVRFSEHGDMEDLRMMEAKKQVIDLFNFLMGTFSVANTTQLLLLFYGFVENGYDLESPFDDAISEIRDRFDNELHNGFVDGNILKMICGVYMPSSPPFYEILVSKMLGMGHE